MKRLIIFMFAAGCALAASQFPEFAQQYRQRLGGAVDELARIVVQFDNDAAASGLSRDAALERYAKSGDDFLGRRGDSLTATLARFEYLKAHLQDLTEAGKFERLAVFARQRDPEISTATLRAYEAAIPTTSEGAAHAAGGFAGGWLILNLLGMPFGRRRRLAQT